MLHSGVLGSVKGCSSDRNLRRLLNFKFKSEKINNLIIDQPAPFSCVEICRNAACMVCSCCILACYAVLNTTRLEPDPVRNTPSTPKSPLKQSTPNKCLMTAAKMIISEWSKGGSYKFAVFCRFGLLDIFPRPHPSQKQIDNFEFYWML